jgi:hypothetical protein
MNAGIFAAVDNTQGVPNMTTKLAIGLVALLMTTAFVEAQGINKYKEVRVDAGTQSTGGNVVVSDGGTALHGFYFCGFDKKTQIFYCGNKSMIAEQVSGESLIPVDPPGGFPHQTMPVDPPGGAPGAKSTDAGAEAHGFQPPK